jgi:hypothetical protein
VLWCEPLAAVRRPPLVVVFVAVFMVALGATTGALMSWLRLPIERYARARVAAKPTVHGLAGSAEYDTEVVAAVTFATEAGLSFLHTHAEGLAPLVLLAASLVATSVPRRRVHTILYALLLIGCLFPVGYLVYALAVLELGRDAGVDLAERMTLTPLGSAAILGFLGVAMALAARRRGRE